MKKHFFLFPSLFFCLFLVVSCFTTTTTVDVVSSDRKQLMLFSEEAVEQSSKQSYEKVLAEAKAKGTLNKNPTTVKRVQTIANRLIAQTPEFRNDAANWKWQVNVITDSTINAWCLPGGRIVIYTGIIDSLKLTDSEIAAILGHEISHALREHSREQMSRQALTSLGVSAVATMLDLGETSSDIINLGAELILTLPFSRSQEMEADNYGTSLMARAGYNPYDAVNVWKKMNNLSSASTPELLSTHPSNNSRIENLNKVAAKVYPFYESTQTK